MPDNTQEASSPMDDAPIRFVPREEYLKLVTMVEMSNAFICSLLLLNFSRTGEKAIIVSRASLENSKNWREIMAPVITEPRVVDGVKDCGVGFALREDVVVELKKQQGENGESRG